MFVALLAGPTHALHGPALSLFRRVAEGTLRLIVTPIVVAELVYVTRDVVGRPSRSGSVRCTTRTASSLWRLP